jgi:hypothetical protein
MTQFQAYVKCIANPQPQNATFAISIVTGDVGNVPSVADPATVGGTTRTTLICQVGQIFALDAAIGGLVLSTYPTLFAAVSGFGG